MGHRVHVGLELNCALATLAVNPKLSLAGRTVELSRAHFLGSFGVAGVTVITNFNEKNRLADRG